MAESDKALLRRYHEHGDLKAREQLIEQYMPLVRSLARRYAYRGEQLEDLVQIGAIGLIKAIDRFDVNRGVELTTYATPNIIGEIKRHFRDRALGGPRAARAPGAERAALEARRRADGRARPLADDRRAREGGRTSSRRWCSRRSSRAARTRRCRCLRAASHEDGEELDPLESLGEVELSLRGRRRPGGARARPRACSTRASGDPPPALLRGPDPVADRRAGRHLADARLAADPALAREDPEADRPRAHAGHQSRTAALRPAAPAGGRAPGRAYTIPRAHDGRAARGLPALLRGARPPARALALADPACRRSLDAVHRRRHAAVQAVLPRPAPSRRRRGSSASRRCSAPAARTPTSRTSAAPTVTAPSSRCSATSRSATTSRTRRSTAAWEFVTTRMELDPERLWATRARGRPGARPRRGHGRDRGVGAGRRPAGPDRAPRRRTTSGRRPRPGRAGRARRSSTTAAPSTAAAARTAGPAASATATWSSTTSSSWSTTCAPATSSCRCRPRTSTPGSGSSAAPACSRGSTRSSTPTASG